MFIVRLSATVRRTNSGPNSLRTSCGPPQYIRPVLGFQYKATIARSTRLYSSSPSTASTMTTITLNTGAKMPAVGFGLWKVTKSSCADTVYNALKAGYRLLDGAGDYGNEKEAVVTSKLWNTFHAHDHAKALVKKQLADWGIDYFDLYLIHFPVSLQYVDPAERYPPEWWGEDKKTVTLASVPYQETWRALEEIHDEGLAKNIGVSNLQGSILLDVLRYARIAPAVLQVELHPYLTQEGLVALAKVHNIAITAYSSFGPQSYVELGIDKSAPSLLQHDIVSSIASKSNKTPAQVLLRWAIQQGLAVIPKSNNHDRLLSNLDVVAWSLSDADMKAISALNINLRLNNPAEIDPRMGIFA
ncbi:hypothetical protein QCA50_002487 [Cerrena zonata]|uniref:NADP-dependent oxidoreductase domain-containing protein n=1 Tax=Cerrena zonata TaxID=2478898 RepID=A0AAW0GTI7_9APHY